MKKIGLVTCKDLPDLCKDDQLLSNEFKRANYNVVPVIWSDQTIDWTDFNLLIIRSVWDYHLYPNAFKNWLNKLKNQQVSVLNDVDTIERNMHKSYLLDIQDLGLNVVQTDLIEKGSTAGLSEIKDSIGLSDFVLKPAISLTAHNTFYIKENEVSAYEKEFKKIVSEKDVLLQPFIPQIKTEGEISLIFIGRKYSHAVRKLPRGNDFRVQTKFGGTVESFQPSADIIEQASQYLEFTEDDILYARVDGVLINENFFLMELELIDPLLHFNMSPDALKLFSDAVSTHC